MGKIQESEIHCPSLQAAFDRAMEKAFDKGVRPSGVTWPAHYGNHVSIKGTLEDSDVCYECDKKIEVDIHLKSVEGAKDDVSGRPVHGIYDKLDSSVSIKVSGRECSQDESQK